MTEKDSKLSSFRAGDFPRKKTGREATGAEKAADALRHYPFLEKLLESDEERVEQFQAACQNTCRNLDGILKHPSDPQTTAMGQAALASYGQSLKLLAELLEIKYQKLGEQSGQK
jgi:hypothetical protein